MIVLLVISKKFFSDFQYEFRSYHSTADLLTAVAGKITRAFNISGATRTAAFDLSNDFDNVWHPCLLHKPKSYGNFGQVFILISSGLSSRQLWMVLCGKSSQV